MKKQPRTRKQQRLDSKGYYGSMAEKQPAVSAARTFNRSAYQLNISNTQIAHETVLEYVKRKGMKGSDKDNREE